MGMPLLQCGGYQMDEMNDVMPRISKSFCRASLAADRISSYRS